MKIYLVGLSGVGKSSFGKKLSARLSTIFVDLDVEIEKREGISIDKIFEKRNEIYFRKVESEELKSEKLPSDFIMATGGGAPCFNRNMEWMLKNGFVVYIQLPIPILATRLLFSYTRPLLKSLSKSELEQKLLIQLSEREEYYSKAHLALNMKDFKSEDMEVLLNKLQSLSYTK